MTQLIIILTIFSSFDWLIYLALIVILGLQIWLVLKAKSISKQRLKVRLALNLFLWLAVLLFVIQPQWKSATNASRVLVISKNIPSENIKKVKDSLKITEFFYKKDFTRCHFLYLYKSNYPLINLSSNHEQIKTKPFRFYHDHGKSCNRHGYFSHSC